MPRLRANHFVDAASELAAAIGIYQSAWQDARVDLGQFDAALAMLVLDANRDQPTDLSVSQEVPCAVCCGNIGWAHSISMQECSPCSADGPARKSAHERIADQTPRDEIARRKKSIANAASKDLHVSPVR